MSLQCHENTLDISDKILDFIGKLSVLEEKIKSYAFDQYLVHDMFQAIRKFSHFIDLENCYYMRYNYCITNAINS